MVDFDFESLKKEIVLASKKAFLEVQSHNTNEKLCSFALCSDDGAMTVCPSINTERHLKRALDSNNGNLYFKFGTAEWQFEAQGADEMFDAICDKVRGTALEVEDRDEDFLWFRQNLFETCVQSLEQLRREGFFEKHCEPDFLLMFSVSDSDLSVEEELKKIARLNNPVVVKEFKQWTDTWGR